MSKRKAPSGSETKDGVQVLHPKARKEWRQWLSANHHKEQSVWLIISHKNRKSPTLYYPEAIEEALCFGWIDSKAVRRNEESFYQYFTPRKPKSKWSKINRARVEKLVHDGLMRPAGQAMINLAKKTGTWDALDTVDHSVVPDDLKKRFERNKKALKNFQVFSPSSRKIILYWILEAKRPETRKKRVELTVLQAAKNLKAYP
jgi:uncharacterized protein YdeI (YjbR/CyaY-like superfamily)